MSTKLEQRAMELAKEGVAFEPGNPVTTPKPDPEWAKVRAAGTELWLDTGDLDEAAKLYTAEFTALTTNNTLLNNEIQKGIYDSMVAKIAAGLREAAPDISERDLLLEIAFVLNAHHGLRLVRQFDARVSVELHTDLSHDVARSVAYGKRYFAICPERFTIKIPLTASGLLSARALAKAGIPVNFTLGFSARQNYLAALVSKTAFLNVFMGRLNAFVSDNGLGSGDNIGEKATLSTQRELLALRAAGRSPSRLIGASMREGAQVATLAGLDVYTMPPKVAAQYRQNPAATVVSRVQDNPPVAFADGSDGAAFAAGTLWDVPHAFKDCVDALVAKDIDAMQPADIQAHLAAAGFGDLLPDWSEAEAKTHTAEGKIPKLATWKERLANGSLGLDALMNGAALFSFVTDQAALDKRVQSLL
jgi:transaldolase